MNRSPKTLHIDTTYAPPEHRITDTWSETVDYHVYDTASPTWRRIEEAMRLDFRLARKAKSLAAYFDVLFAGSERVAIPLAGLRIDKPIVTLVHHMASPRKRYLFKLLNVQERWARVGCLSDADLECMRDYFEYPSEYLFKYISAPLGQFRPAPRATESGPIMSVGVSHRDYGTLFAALHQLPYCRTVIYGKSRYEMDHDISFKGLPSGVELADKIALTDLVLRYQTARFVVLPLHDTTQFSAGCTAALEAAAAGRAVIATDTPGMREYIRHGETGLLVPPYDVEAMRAAIERLWDDPEATCQMGCRAREHMERNYRPEVAQENLRRALYDAWTESKAADRII